MIPTRRCEECRKPKPREGYAPTTWAGKSRLVVCLICATLIKTRARRHIKSGIHSSYTKKLK